MRYIIHKKLIPENKYTAPFCQEPFTEVLSAKEYADLYPNLVPESLFRHSMGQPGHCKADIFKHYILGTLSIPCRSGNPQWGCCFYLDKEKLIFIGKSDALCCRIHRLLEQIEQWQIADINTPSQALFEFLEQLISGDEEFLDGYEENLDKRENEMNENVNEIPKYFDHYILKTRKELLLLSRYYKQLTKMGQYLTDCPNGIIDADAKDMYRFFTTRTERLSTDAQSLREYSIQIRDMYQSRIDVRHNKVIQLLTIVTAIFMPLTLITGWYGMNFPGIPEFHWPSGYLLVILLAAAIIIIEWIIFKKKKWL